MAKCGSAVPAIAILILSPLPLTAQTVHYTKGKALEFGVGYNTLTGEYAGNCLTKADKGDIQPAGNMPGKSPGQLTKWEMSSVQDISQLEEKLDFSASASASFAAGSASADVKYVKSRSFNKYHEFLYVDAAIANTTDVWTPPKNALKDNLDLRKRPLDFLRKCGDAFVRTITYGGELTAVVEINTQAEESTSAVGASVSGSYGTASAQADVTTRLRQAISSRAIHVEVFRNGGVGAIPDTTSDVLIKASQDFPTEVVTHPVPMEADLASYDIIDPASPLTATQQQYIGPLFRMYQRVLASLGNLKYIKGHTGEFRVVSGPGVSPDALATQQTIQTTYDFSDALTQADKDRVNAAYDALDDLSHKLEAAASACLANTRRCTGALPAFPEKEERATLTVVRVFETTQPYDTHSGPVSISLPIDYMCRVENITGGDFVYWIGHPNGHCSELPKGMTHGHILIGNWDSDYSDNTGQCTYHFLCARK